MAGRGLAAATREAYGRMARGYVCFLESGGIFDVEAADAGTVLRQSLRNGGESEAGLSRLRRSSTHRGC